PHLAARKQRAIELEAGIFGGGADQGHCSPLDMREKGVLLGPVEAMDLVAKEDRAATQYPSLFRLAHNFFDPGNPVEHRRELDKLPIGVMGDQPGNGGLAGPRRSPEHTAAHVASTDRVA